MNNDHSITLIYPFLFRRVLQNVTIDRLIRVSLIRSFLLYCRFYMTFDITIEILCDSSLDYLLVNFNNLLSSLRHWMIRKMLLSI